MLKIKLTDNIELHWEESGLYFQLTIKDINTVKLITWFIPKRALYSLIQIFGMHKTITYLDYDAHYKEEKDAKDKTRQD